MSKFSICETIYNTKITKILINDNNTNNDNNNNYNINNNNINNHKIIIKIITKNNNYKNYNKKYR